jgi:hypothetical protein
MDTLVRNQINTKFRNQILKTYNSNGLFSILF